MKSSLEYFRHETASVEEGAKIGRDSKLWHYVQVCRDAAVGESCVLGKNVFIGSGVQVGRCVKIQNNVSVFKGVTLGDGVFVGPSVTFTNVMNPRAEIERKDEFRPTHVGRGATIGANSTIVCGNTIGEYALVGAGAVVTRPVRPYAVVVGNPAREIGWVNKEGERVMMSPVDEPQVDAPILALDTRSDARAHRDEYLAAVERVIDSGQYILGPEVEAFEDEVAHFLKVEHVIGVSSGTDALLLALMAKNIGPGDEVITTPFSFFATVGAILRLGATPVFVDIDVESFNISIERALAAWSPRVKAVIGVQLFGQSFRWSELGVRCRAEGVLIVDDAAQAFGARGVSGMIGAEADVSCFSFFPSKNLGSFGDGGAISTRDTVLAQRIRSLRVHGATKKYHHTYLGGNFRLHALQAALLRTKLPRLPALVQARERNSSIYNRLFEQAGLVSGGMITPPPQVGPHHTFNQYVVRARQRDKLLLHLQGAGVGAQVYYPELLSTQPCVVGRARIADPLQIAEQACHEVIALPIHPQILPVEQEKVVTLIRDFYQNR